MTEVLNGYRCDATADPEGAEVEKVRCQFFPERTDLPYVNVDDIVCIVSTVTESRSVYLTNTGGNCGAVEAELEGGILLVTDADVFTYSAGTWQSFYGSWTVGVYSNEDDCSEARYMAFGKSYDCSGESLIDTLRRALAGATDHKGPMDYRASDPAVRGE